MSSEYPPAAPPLGTQPPTAPPPPGSQPPGSPPWQPPPPRMQPPPPQPPVPPTGYGPGGPGYGGPGYGGGPGGGGYGPGGYPPGAYPPGERKLSAASLMSLIFGIIGCVPFITSLLAVILGLVGISRTRDPRYSGRGMAIAGLLLGLLGLIGWGAISGKFANMYTGSKDAAALAHQFTADLAAGNVQAAAAKCDPSVPPEEIQALSDQFKSWGTFHDLTIPAREEEIQNGQTTWRMLGITSFDKTSKRATFAVKKQPDGSYKITKVEFQ